MPHLIRTSPKALSRIVSDLEYVYLKFMDSRGWPARNEAPQRTGIAVGWTPWDSIEDGKTECASLGGSTSERPGIILRCSSEFPNRMLRMFSCAL